jgi:hypothetical protein
MDFSTFREIHSQLRSAHGQVSMRLAVALFLDSSVKSAVQSALDADGARIQRLADTGELGMGVINGTLSAEKWKAIAKTTHEDIAAQGQVVGQSIPSLSRFWDEVITPTSTTIAEGVERAGELAFPTLTLAVIGLVSLAIIRWKS